MLKYILAEGYHIIVLWGTQHKAVFTGNNDMNSSQEEAYIKLIFHAADVTTCTLAISTHLSIYLSICLSICFPDIDVSALAIRRYTALCKNTNFVKGTTKNRRTIKLSEICDALEPSRAAC